MHNKKIKPLKAIKSMPSNHGQLRKAANVVRNTAKHAAHDVVKAARKALPSVEHSITPITPKGVLDGIAKDHDLKHDWQEPAQQMMSKLKGVASTGLDRAASKVTNPTALAAISKAKSKLGGE